MRNELRSPHPIDFVDGVGVVRLVGGVDDGRPVTSDHGGECFIEQGRVSGMWAEVSSRREELLIDCAPQPQSSHATIAESPGCCSASGSQLPGGGCISLTWPVQIEPSHHRSGA